MKSHVYEFDNHIYKQTNGGPIGLEITGDLAGIFMAWWDKQLLHKLHQDGKELLLYKRYIDDINFAVKTPNGEQNSNNKQPEIDTGSKDRILYIGNSIHPTIQLEQDNPNKHKDNKMPLLDIKLWTEERDDGNRKYNHHPTRVLQKERSNTINYKREIEEGNNIKKGLQGKLHGMQMYGGDKRLKM